MGFTNLIIEQTSKTPQIDLNRYTGHLIFSGKSTPENADKLYGPVLRWAEQYVEDPMPFTHLKLDLEYFNTASALWLSKIINVLGLIEKPDSVLMVHLFMPVEDFENLRDFDDIRDTFIPVADIYRGSVTSLCMKLCAKDDSGSIVRETFVFFDAEESVNSSVSQEYLSGKYSVAG
jgi:hypothetical protein